PSKNHLVGPTGIMAVSGAAELEVQSVEEGSPADGKLKKGDVIVGANGKDFSGDVRQQIAAAIEHAESPSAKGVLTLALKGGGAVDLQLQVLGSHARTAPWDCRKTDAIVTRIADQMVASKDFIDGQMPVGWIGLLATGEQKYIDVVKEELPKQPWVKAPDPEVLAALLAGDKDLGYIGWYWGYQMIALAEYHLLTGDPSVLPALEAYALTMARGQDPAGIWGHRLATKARNGRLPGYAHINNPSLSTVIGMQMALKCGIENPEIQAGIDRSVAFYKSFSGEGALPYGVHGPYTNMFNNNGSSAMAAIVMALAGEKEAARFFSEQSAASYHIQETGHATHYFNILWTPLGANIAGPEVSQEFFRRGNWVRTLYRAWNDRFTFDGAKSKCFHDGGALLLAYCLPRKQLHITGKDADESLWVKGDKVNEVIEQGQFDYAKLGNDELIGLFGHRAPQVNREAIWTLRGRQGDFIPKVVKLITDGTVTEKRSAIGFFGYKCPSEWALPQIDLIGGVLRDTGEHPKVRSVAAYAICWHGEPAQKFYPDMLKLILEEEPDDPFQLIDQEVGKSLNALAPDPFAAGLVDDKDLFYKAALKLADNPRQEARAYAMKMLRSMPEEDFHRVADAVKEVVQNLNPDYQSYHNPQDGVQDGALLLADLGVEEGMEWSWAMLDAPDGKGGFKARAILTILKGYGPAAKPYLEKIQNDPKHSSFLMSGRWKKMYDALVQAVEKGEDKKLVPFEQAKEAK
ncbi:MAG: DUF6288 domain-containing protein, partial [Haloferula sp.]